MPTADDESNDPSHCFICLEECDERVVCHCTHMHCHTSCQQKLLDRIRVAECSVCKSPYTNVRIVQARRSFECADVILIWLMMLVILFSLALLWLYMLYPMQHYLLVEAVIMMSALGVIFKLIVSQPWTFERFIAEGIASQDV